MNWITLGSESGKPPLLKISPTTLYQLSSEAQNAKTGEVVMVKLSATDHDLLHKDPKAFVMAQGYFAPDVIQAVSLLNHPSINNKECILVLRHWPDCAVAGGCLFR